MVNIRDYEVSIWTLQDSFIAILKQSNLENMEKIQEPKMVLKDDGDNSFSFKIPMYLKRDTDLAEKPYFKDESVFVENPIWYTVRNGNLISSLRKIKVIFNKHSSDEEVFEFIINDIKETHEGKSKICEVECGGLAFHELGKQGYDIVLSGEEYEADYKEWFDSDRTKPEPINNIDYWIKKVLDNSNWDYVINMDWSLYDGIIDGNRSGNVRQANKVYREPYISSWTIDENANKLFAANSVTNLDELEKRAIVEGAESNRYNLLQSIAEAFQVFCKFKYLYDDNYHIIGRQVVFYNNFIKEAEEIVDFNYGYNTNQIVREMDGTDLVTKMYVKSLSNSGTFAGEIGLRDTEANPSLENYLLNFNYLYKIGTISQEQYDEIDGFQKELRKLNLEYEEETLKLQDCINKIPIEEAIVKTSGDIIEQAGERVQEASAAIGALVNENGLIGFSQQNPRHFVVIHDTSSSRYYINIGREYQSFVPSSFYLYAAIDADGAVDSKSSITGLKFEKDSNGLITKVTFPNTQLSNDSTSVYAVFQYNPYTPNKIIKNIWASKQKQAEKDKENAESRLNNLNSLKETYEKNIQTILNNKQNCINRFERIMGPALREGTWQPEDEYVNYKKDSVFSLGNGNNSLISVNNITDGVAHFSWEPSWGSRMEEQTLDYAYGANETRYYPCIDLSKVSSSLLTEEQLSNLNLVYRDPYLSSYYPNSTYARNDPRVNHYLQVGADNGCKFMFIKPKNGTEITPVLMVLGMTALTTTTTEISPEAQIQADARLSVISYSGDNILEDEIVNSLTWIKTKDLPNYEVVYPKFSISIDRYIPTTPENKIYYNNSPLEEYKDYYAPIFHENKYWIMIKPEVAYFKSLANYEFYYSTTTAPEAIYLDAVEILRENSVPKVSYTISPLAINQNFIKNAYDRLGQLAHINDQELKFENVQGYISEVDLDLDKPWEDSYIIKNYKTKFEDLFSTIVAQTEAMKKNSQLFSMVSNAFNTNGLLEDAIIDNIKDRLDIYIPTPIEIYSQYEPQIRAELQQAFNEAGEVLVAAQNSVNDVNNLNLTNSRILGSFVENLKDSLDKAAIDINKEEGYINIYTRNPESKETSLLKIDNKNGIYLGSNKAITFYSGPIGATNSGASVEINQNRILFGVSSGSSGTAVDLTKDYIVFGAGNIVYENPLNPSAITVGSETGTAGVKITKDSIKMATGNYSTNSNQNTRNYISMDSNGIELANSNAKSSGAIVKIDQNGVLIGTAPAPNTVSQYITNIKNNSDTMSNYNGAKFQVYAPNFVVDTNGKLYAYGAYIAGDIIANSFQLSANASIPQDKVDGLINSLNGLQTDINKTKAISATITYAKSQYGVLNNNNPPSDITSWSTSLVTTDDSKPYLWTRTITTYASGNTSSSYSVSYKGKDGKYVTKFTPIYYLKTNTTTVPDPTTNLSSNDVVNTWTKIIPTYQIDATYYRSDMQEWSDGSTVTFTTKYIDYGLTYASSTATSASNTARNLADTYGAIFTTNGLTSYGNYNVALLSSKKLLIGANSGIDIWNTNNGNGGAAISLDKDKIALHGAAINITTDTGTNNVVALNYTGITLGTGGKLEIGSNNFVVNNNTSGEIFRVGPSTDPYLQYNISSSGNVFKIRGEIYATSGWLGGSSGWKITPNYLYSASLSGNNWNNFTGDGIVLFSNNTYSEIHLYKNSKNLLNINTDATEANDFILALGNFDSDNPKNFLGYTAGGVFIMDGEVRATSGTIGGWNIQKDFIGDAKLRGDCKVGMSCVDLDSTSEDESAEGYYCAFWAGGSRRTNFTLDAKNTAFFVRKNGYVHITKGEIMVKYLMSKSIMNKTYRIYVSTDAPIAGNFSVGNGRFKLDRILWIRPKGGNTWIDSSATDSTTGAPIYQYQNCEIQWCKLNGAT